MIKILLFFIISFSVFSHHHVENIAGSTEIGYRSSLRIFKFTDTINYMAEYSRSDIKRQNNYDTLELGGKYRLFRNLKIGLYYSRHFKNQGERWNNEDFIISELSPRYLLNFLPGERWVFEFRARYEHNLSVQQHNVKLRPGLTYFWFKDGNPFMNIFLQHEIYHALNYAGEGNLAHWTYLGSLFHYNDKFKWSPFISYVSERLRAEGEFNVDSFLLGLNLLFYL